MPKVTFNNKNALFFPALKSAVEDYFKSNNIQKTGNWKLYIKTAVLIPVAVALYVSVLFISMPAILSVTLCALLGFVLASIGFNVMHDACHGSYSTNSKVNDTLGLTLNALGGNAFIWKQKHNIIHHTYTNVDGLDDDIGKSPLMRQCSTQKWVPMHRIQHIYVILIYAISSFAWVFIMDFVKYLSRKVYTTPLQPMKLTDHMVFWGSKVLYLAFYIALPIALVGWQAWAIGFAVMHVVMGFTLAIVFQLAHVVEETEFEVVGEDAKVIENEWAIHQIKTTANFAPGHKIISWFVGGLNYQVEHHLFPRISHVHYPALSKIVAAKCAEHNLTYNSIPTMQGAVISHFRFMKALGAKP
ncbi:linoleoyl-CoA desaturase [Chitinophaga ginsengisegetis]|uniref:Linoleoyl-CoA desaturase n=1 Tax=Chitinophaga ginsengisegetis TaxID=393003 RepID=A0A1T5P5K5_9BACT|nr:acyl-CoA desaturase [Chitinophaga ginsengisegetis]MDR6566485.1 linoleoyl-CoA desaturase [Chitinophaga ginsengisegetis]MDR6646215.1 linoleoyl-CoA desaturase [Chitinophaga ginsengisegetis]MDR6651192.1 linoleoyl-CoA desaturase [Chitinophaga ginsengisegetis]SKD07981.1 linoleoyl-CoA desaturase [Chitinophaga ginsengisegetis]